MDSSLILVKCITLLYRESHLPNQSEGSSTLIKDILEYIKLPEVNLTLDAEKERLSGLKSTALYLCSNPPGTPVDKITLLQRLKVNCLDNTKLYEAFVQGIERELDEDSLKRVVLAIRRTLSESFKENEIVKILRNASNEVTFNREKIPNLKNYVAEVMSKLEPYQHEVGKKDPAIVGSVDLGDDASMNAAFEDVKSSEEEGGIMRTGWQGLNIMTQGGFRRGEQWVLPALQHKYKTGFTLSLFKQVAMYNEPYMLDEKKKPLLLRISFEDSLVSNMRFLYENIFFNEHRQMPDMKLVAPADMASYVKEKMGVKGYNIQMIRVNPSEWIYRDIQNYVIQAESEGFEVHMVMIDYLPMMPTTGCEEGPSGHALRDLYRRTRNFFSARKIALLTPHQLSTEAKQLVRDGHQDFVKQVIGKGYFAGSKQIDQEVDGEIYLHIEKLNKRAYLTIHRGKHRGVPVIPDDDMYMVLPFPEKGPIPDDLNGPRIDCSKIGGGPRGGGNEVPFHEFET